MKCDKFQDDLSAFLDGELPDGRQEEVRAHLKGCSDCASLMQLLDSTRITFKGSLPSKVSDGFQHEIKEAMAQSTATTKRSWIVWAAPVALAASLVLVFFWNGGAVDPMKTAGREVYEQMLTLNMPDLVSPPDADTFGISEGLPPGSSVQHPGLEPDNSIPGMGDYFYSTPGASS